MAMADPLDLALTVSMVLILAGMIILMLMCMAWAAVLLLKMLRKELEYGKKDGEAHGTKGND